MIARTLVRLGLVVSLSAPALCQEWYRGRGVVTQVPSYLGAVAPIQVGDTFTIDLGFEFLCPLQQTSNHAVYEMLGPQDFKRCLVVYDSGIAARAELHSVLHVYVDDWPRGSVLADQVLFGPPGGWQLHPVEFVVNQSTVGFDAHGHVEIRFLDTTNSALDSLQIPELLELADYDIVRVDLYHDLSFPVVYSGTLTRLEKMIGRPFCADAWPPSSSPPLLTASGSEEVALNHLELVTEGLPDQEPAMVLASIGRVAVADHLGLAGFPCLAQPLVRMRSTVQPVLNGTYRVRLDLNTHPVTGLGPVQPGETLCFQVWCRDASIPEGARLTTGLQVTFE